MEGHLYAVADIHLQLYKIVFTASDSGRMENYPAVANRLHQDGVDPLFITNGGIYGKDNRPLGLLITPKGREHKLNLAAGSGNFSWDSAVFQISDDQTASIMPAKNWQDSQHIVAATQSGPQLADESKINSGFRSDSKWSFRRTAIGIDQSNKQLVHLVVSRDAVTLFELATFMVSEIHCAEALHLDGDLSAFYFPSASDQFLFADPGDRIVTGLSISTQKTK